MKKFGSIALGLALLSLGSCASDEPSIKDQQSTKGDVFATLTLSLPTTRSATDEPGTPENPNPNYGETNSDATPDFEVGFDRENQVKSVYVLLAKNSGTEAAPVWEYVACSYQENVLSNGNVGNNISYTLSFESAEFAEAIAPATAGQTVKLNVFAYCNPTAQLLDSFDELKKSKDINEFFNGTENVEDATTGNGCWGAGSFLMTNSKISDEVEIEDYSTLVEKYGKPENPLKLGIVYVERVASRFDFRDYQYEDNTGSGNKLDLNTYPIKLDANSNEIVAYVQLNGMSLVNMAKEFYYLPRVSDTGLDSPMTLCGVETSTNFVVSPNAALKQDDNAGKNLFANYFYQLYDGTATVSPNTFDYTPFSDITEQDNWGGNDRYKFWRYCTENTIPGAIWQTEGISTGIYFKGQIKPYGESVAPGEDGNWDESVTQAQKLAWAMEQGEVLYFFKEDQTNVIYAGVKNLIRVAQQNPLSKLHAAVVEAFGDIDAETFDINSVKDLDGTKAGIGLYRHEKDQVDGKYVYNVYYFYKNRHNDNLINYAMGPMEFATVRNNIYKLYVSNVHMFGHPGSTPDDPDPEDPDDPDETEKVYFDVNIQVVPWVVRVNDIEF